MANTDDIPLRVSLKQIIAGVITACIIGLLTYSAHCLVQNTQAILEQKLTAKVTNNKLDNIAKMLTTLQGAVNKQNNVSAVYNERINSNTQRINQLEALTSTLKDKITTVSIEAERNIH